MRVALSIGAISAIAIAGVGQASAQSLEIRQIRANQETLLLKRVEQANDACRSELKAKFDWTGVQDADLKRSSAANECGDILYSVGAVCGRPGGREAVRSQIRTVVCGFATERSMSLADGVLKYNTNFQPNKASEMIAFLQDNLRAEGPDADSLTVRQQKIEPEKQLVERTSTLNRLCKSNIATRIEWSGVTPDLWAEFSYPRSSCTGALSAVQSACENPGGLQAVNRQIRTIVCAYGPKPAVALRDGVLTFTMNFKVYTDATPLYEYLNDNLRPDGPDGDSLKIRRIKARQEDGVAKSVVEVNRFCDATIAVRFDWSAVPTELTSSPSELAWRPERHCSGVLSAIRSLCSDDIARSAVKQKINTVVCGFGARRSVGLEAGVLNYKINLKANDDHQAVQDYLRKNL
jgi:hypothetical protein